MPMAASRRCFLKAGAIALVGFGSGHSLPPFLLRAADAASSRNKTLIVLFQRGAADGLNIVVPHGESRYYQLRPGIAVPRPGKRDGVLDLDGQFGFHPALASFKRLYDEGQLAVIHAAGSPDATRSHFDAQDFMESGTPGVKSTRDGWLNRYLQVPHSTRPSSFRAVASTSQLPRMLSGSATALAVSDVSKFGIPGRYGQLAQTGLERLYAASGDPLLSSAARETFEAVDTLERLDPSGYRPANGARYPQGPFGKQLTQIAQLIKAEVGLEIAFAESGGWDHHVNEGGAQGQLANLLRQFSGGISALTTDLGRRMQDVVIVTLSEFGRTARQNGSGGTDHGHANTMFVIGGPVRGGKLYGKWPGLDDDQLHDGRDLTLTTDFRDVIAQVLIGHLKAANLDQVFPDHTSLTHHRLL
jgi:uncharacterized protein (DUF1501 family)